MFYYSLVCQANHTSSSSLSTIHIWSTVLAWTTIDKATYFTLSTLAILESLGHVQGTVGNPPREQNWRPTPLPSPSVASCWSLNPCHYQLKRRNRRRRLHHFSSSSLDEAIMPPPLTSAYDFRHFQDLFCKIADSLQIPLEEVKYQQHNLLDTLHTSSSSKVPLLIHEALLNCAKLLWQTLVSIPPTCKCARKNCSREGCEIYILPSHPKFFGGQCSAQKRLAIPVQSRQGLEMPGLIWTHSVLISHAPIKNFQL